MARKPTPKPTVAKGTTFKGTPKNVQVGKLSTAPKAPGTGNRASFVGSPHQAPTLSGAPGSPKSSKTETIKGTPENVKAT